MKEEARWFLNRADHRDKNVQLILANFYQNGWGGIPQNDALAAKWVRKAADQGYAEAQFKLGLFYHQGIGVPKDYIQAYMWHNLASAQGHEEAKEEKLELSKKMTKEQIAEAQKLSTQWMERKAKEKKAP